MKDTIIDEAIQYVAGAAVALTVYGAYKAGCSIKNFISKPRVRNNYNINKFTTNENSSVTIEFID